MKYIMGTLITLAIIFIAGVILFLLILWALINLSKKSWVRAKDRLPEVSDNYLVTLDNGDVIIANYIANEDFAIDVPGWYDVGEHLVIAWRDIPNAYNEVIK